MKSNLTQQLEKHNLTRGDLIILAGTSASLIRAIEKHGYKPRLEARERIAKALDVEPNAIWPEKK